MFFRVLLVVFGLFRPGAARAPLILVNYNIIVLKNDYIELIIGNKLV